MKRLLVIVMLLVLGISSYAPIARGEWLGWRGRSLGVALHLFAAALLALGLRAVWAVFS